MIIELWYILVDKALKRRYYIFSMVMEGNMMNEQLDVISPAEEDSTSCQHHWVIQEADGPFSLGLCQSCGQFKEFKNYLEASHWGDEKSRSEPRGNLLGRPTRSRIIIEDDEEF